MPVFNEEGRLPATLERLAAFAVQASLHLEVIVADDGSVDGTAAAYQRWAPTASHTAMTTRFITIRHRGKGAAVRAGMAFVNAPVVGYCDADLSAGPDAIVQLREAIGRGADVAMASRGLSDSVLDIRQPWYREFAGRTFNVGLRLITGLPFKDTQCGLKLFRAEAARDIFPRQRLDGFAFDIEVILLAVKLGLRVEEVPIHWAHSEGSKVSLFRDSRRMAGDAWRVTRRLRREHFGDRTTHQPGVPDDNAMEMMTGGEDTHWWHVAKRQLVTELLDPPSPSRRCLDIGCGGGAMLAAAAQHGGAVGMDLSTRALQHARARGLTALLRAEGASVPLASGVFSRVLALDVIEHHAQPELLLKEIARVLAPGGRIIVTVPAFQWMWSYADDVLGHYRRYTKGRLADELKAAGFVLVRTTYFHSWLLPIAWTVRVLKAIIGRTGAADDAAVPDALNRLLLRICAIERRYLRRRDLRFGLSVLAVGEKRPSE